MTRSIARLDCDSIDSTYESFESLFEVTKAELEAVFKGLDLDKYASENPHAYLSADEIVFRHLKDHCKPRREPVEICWFHATRTTESNRFAEGISALQDMKEPIWRFLFSLASASNWIDELSWQRFRSEVETKYSSQSAGLYGMKIADSFHWGPYAFLVRDVALHSKEIGGQDYLRSPEIVEDICRCFLEQYGKNLLEKFRQHTKPCIVKFIDSGPGPGAIRVAAYYLHSMLWKQPLSHLLMYSFDGKGKPVPHGHIERIDFHNDEN